MGARHDAAVAKEKRLEEVTRPATATKRVREEAEPVKEEKKSDKKQAKKRNVEINKTDLENTKALEEDDNVAEGINWSDDEKESSDKDSD